MSMLVLVCVVVLAYLVGGVPFGYLIARARGVDIFAQGSGNIGATNVGRVLGRKFGVLVFVLDFLKGAVPTLAASLVPAEWAEGLPPHTLAVAAGVSAVLGHSFPVYLRFRGGKGVATGAGVVAVLLTPLIVPALLVWGTVVSASRMVSLASLAAALALVLLRLVSVSHPLAPENVVLTLFCGAAAGLVFARHHANIGRIVRGQENKIGESVMIATVAKALHVLAVGLWFGMAVFFTFVVGFGLFGAFEEVSANHERPTWFPLPPAYAKAPPSPKFPDPLSKEQGSRAAGHAIGPLFDWYFRLQAGCALVALVTALGWSRRLDRVRQVILGVALVGVLAGWWLEVKVSDLRVPRNQLTDEVLLASQPSAEQIQRAEDARATFGMWHGISVVVNLFVVLLVTVAMLLAVSLPASPVPAGVHELPT